MTTSFIPDKKFQRTDRPGIYGRLEGCPCVGCRSTAAGWMIIFGALFALVIGLMIWGMS